MNITSIGVSACKATFFDATVFAKRARQRLVCHVVAVACAAMFGAPGLAVPRPAMSAESTVTTRTEPAPTLSKADLEELLAPIALYPDTLLASTLAACVYEEDLKAAAAYVAGGGNVEQLSAKDWDPSVKAVAAMPEVIKLLGENAQWAAAVGQAYLVQGPDVMAAVQSLRARAWANGALKSTPQQTVVTEGQVIVIEPATPEIIYVPTYNPSVVYVDHYDSGDVAAAGVIGFGVGLATGLIIANNMDCDWHGGCLGYGHYGGDVDVNVNRNININSANINTRPGQAGSPWKPNRAKVSPTTASGTALNNYKGVGSSGGGAANAKVPGRTAGTAPIAGGRPAPAPKPRPAQTARPSPPAPRPSDVGTRPSAPAARPAAPATRPSAPAARPSAPVTRPSAHSQRPSAPAARPSPAPRSSGFNPSGGGGSRGGGGGGGRGRGR